MDRTRKGGRNVLGFEDDPWNNNGTRNPDSMSSEQLFETQNDRLYTDISERANVLHSIALEIEGQVRESNSILDTLERGITGAQLTLSSSMSKLKDLSKTATSRHMLYLILFVLFVFFLLYMIVTYSRKPNT
eukprot:gene9939-12187_t